MDAKQIMLDGIERWNAHDRDGFLANMDDEMTFFDMASGQTHVGREQIGKGFYDLWNDAYPDNLLKETVVICEGERVCLQGHFIGTNTGVFQAGGMELPPTGKRIDAPFVYIGEVRNGKMARAWHHYDRLLAFEQEGLITPERVLATVMGG